jgi:MFS family permease
VPLILCGLGMGIGVTTTTILALSLVSEEEHGETSSGIQIADVLGSVLGIAAATGAFAIWHSPQNDRWLFATIFLVLAAVAALVVPAAQRIRT